VPPSHCETRIADPHAAETSVHAGRDPAKRILCEKVDIPVRRRQPAPADGLFTKATGRSTKLLRDITRVFLGLLAKLDHSPVFATTTCPRNRTECSATSAVALRRRHLDLPTHHHRAPTPPTKTHIETTSVSRHLGETGPRQADQIVNQFPLGPPRAGVHCVLAAHRHPRQSIA